MRQNNFNVSLSRVHTSLQILFIRKKKKKEETYFTYLRSLKRTYKTGNMGRRKNNNEYYLSKSFQPFQNNLLTEV